MRKKRKKEIEKVRKESKITKMNNNYKVQYNTIQCNAMQYSEA